MRRASHLMPLLQNVKLREMKRTGQEMGLNKVFAMILLLACLGLVIWGVYGKGFANITYLAKLLPGFNETIPEGTTIVGVNLETNDLMYFTGEKWRKIDFSKPDDKFTMGGYEFKPQEMKMAIENFYFSGERRPSKLRGDIKEWRYFEAEVYRKEIAVKFDTKKGFAGNNLRELFLLNHNNELKYAGAIELSEGELYYPHFSSLDLLYKPTIKEEIIAWRDQILEGQPCEKFILLNLKVNDQKNERYSVRKVDNYIFVDLSKPVSSTEIQDWDNVACFKENYIPHSEVTKLPLSVYFIDHFLGRNLRFTFDYEKGWASQDTTYTVDHWFYEEKKTRYPFEAPRNRLLVSGLYNIFRTGAGEIYALSVYLDESGKVDIFYEDEEFTKDEANKDKMDKLLYDILNGYNKNLLIKGGLNE